MRFLLQTLCTCAIALMPWGLHGQNLEVKITAGGATNTVSNQPSLEAALNGTALEEVTAIEVTAGTFGTADWNYLKNNNKQEVGFISLANFSITDGVDAVADIPDTDAEHPYFSTKLRTFSAAKLQTVGRCAFYNCTGLTNVNMPQVITLNDYALYNTAGLIQANLPLVETVGGFVFASSGIPQITLPNASSIGTRAFYNTGYLSTIILPKVSALTSNDIFYGSALTYLGLSATKPTLSGSPFNGAPMPRYLLLVDANGTPLTGADSIAAAANYGSSWQNCRTSHSRVPLNVTVNGTKNGTGNSLDEALKSTGVARASIKTIEVTAGEFLATDWVWLKTNMHNALTHFTITDGITAVANMPAVSGHKTYFKSGVFTTFSAAKLNMLGQRAFYNTTSLVSVNLPNTTAIEQQAFAICVSLKDAHLPAATRIEANAFAQCGSLTAIHLPKISSLTRINIFDGSALTHLKLGKTPITMGNNTMDGAPSPRIVELVDDSGHQLTGSTLSDAVAAYKAHKGYNSSTGLWYGCRINGSQAPITVRINDSYNRIGATLETALSSDPLGSISSIEVLEGELLATDWVFLRENRNALSLLKRFVVVDSPSIAAVSDIPATSTASSYFNNQFQELSVAKLQRVGLRAFYHANSLKKAHLPHVKKLDTYAFVNCSMLDTITLPQLEEFAGNGIFWGSGVTYMKLGSTPPTVSHPFAFQDAPEIRYLLLCDANGAPLTDAALAAANDAYRNDAGYNSTTKLWHGWSLDKSSDTLTMIVNESLTVTGINIKECLDSTEHYGIPLGNIESIEVIKGSVTNSDWTHLKDETRNINNIKRFTIANSATSVADIKNLGSNATKDDLYLAPSIEELSIAKMTSIGNYAFQYAPNLKYIHMPDVKTVMVGAFRYLPSLTKVSMPNVEYVRSYFLTGCSKLTILQLGINPIDSIESFFCGSTPDVRYLQLVDSKGQPLTGQAQDDAKENYKNDVKNYNKNTYAAGPAPGKWRGWTLGTSIKIDTDDAVAHGSLSVPFDFVLHDTLTNAGINIGIAPDAGYRLKENSLYAYNPHDPSVIIPISGTTLTLPAHDVVVTAEFEPITYSITATSAPTEGGSVSGAGIFAENASATLIATANEGYDFVHWTEGGSPISNEASITFTATADRDLTAVFQKRTYQLTYTAGANGSIVGNATQTVAHGENGTEVEAKAIAGYHFKQWSDERTDNPRTDNNVTASISVTAVFEKDINTFSIIATANPNEGGQVNGAGTYNEGTQAKLKATPNEGYEFTGWFEGVANVSTDAEYSFTVTGTRTLVAEFKKIEYQLNYTAGTGGSIAGNASQTVAHGEDGTQVEAKADVDFHFVQWSDGLTEPLRTDKNVNRNISVTAEFEADVVNTFEITANAFPAEGGVIDGDGALRENTEAELNATANRGYIFVEWQEGGTHVSLDNPYKFNVDRNRELVAVFDSLTYTLTYTAGENGTITGQLVQNVKYTKSGTEVVAVPNPGYRFVKWNDNVLTASRTDINVDDHINATAIFEPIPPTHTIAATPDPIEGGTINGAGDYEEGQTATLTATANTGFAFAQWTDGVNTITDNPYSFEVTGPRTLTAVFTTAPTYTIATTAEPSEGGTITGGGQYNENATATLTATANEGYRFVRWTKDGSEMSTSAVYSFSVTENINLVAVFMPIPTYTISATASPAEGGSISGNSAYYEGDQAVLTAIPAAGYRFVRWTDGGIEVGTSEQYTIDNISRDYDALVAEFVHDATLTVYTISTTAEPAEGGSITGDGQYNENATATLTATANEGYRFVRWMSSGQELSTNSTFSFEVISDSTLVAVFELAPVIAPTYTISTRAEPAEGGSITGAGQYDENAMATLTATANEGYRFVRWMASGQELSTNNTFSFEVISDSTLVAVFEQDANSPCTPYSHEFSATASDSYEWNGQEYTQSGDYVANLKSAEGCDSIVTLHLTIVNTTSLFDIRHENLSVYPNPTTGELWVTVPSTGSGTVEGNAAAGVSVYTLNGQLMLRVPTQGASAGSAPAAAGRIRIDLSGLPAGMYIVRVGNAAAKVVRM
ncbi:MAG: leucine-rich repeat protein [Bacteroidales bacterium]|nr:leucine-rich repeat protein [Bacteroidales bacterium]